MWSIFVLAVTLFLSLFSSDVLAKGCTSNTECKGDRICEGGKCVSPNGVDDPDEPDDPTPRPPRKQRGLPSYCCTSAGKLGPYTNPGIREGESCYGTTLQGQTVFGAACY